RAARLRARWRGERHRSAPRAGADPVQLVAADDGDLAEVRTATDERMAVALVEELLEPGLVIAELHIGVGVEHDVLRVESVHEPQHLLVRGPGQERGEVLL